MRFVFGGLLLPHGRCDTDHVAIYQGSTRQGQPLHTFCGSRRQQVEYTGPNLLLEFNSGPAAPPFDYNGFLLELQFEEGDQGGGGPASEAPPPSPQPPPPELSAAARGNCDVVVRENDSRSGHFDTRGHDWSTLCRFVFVGRPADVVHISLFNYKLRARSCTTAIEIYDGAPPTRKPIRKICSPQTKHARDRGGSFLEHQTFVSSGPALTLALRRQQPSAAAAAAHPAAAADAEFVDGAYLFHDEQVLGTLQPSAICDVSFYGMSSPASGAVTNPGGQHLYWNVEGPLRCVQQFVPGANQSVTVSVRSAGAAVADTGGDACQTRCGDGGCECAPPPRSSRPFDRLLLVAEDGRELVCLCGDYHRDWLPVTVRSWTALSLVYQLAHYSWNAKGFEFAATYAFETDATCGVSTVMAQSGEIRSANASLAETQVEAEESLDIELNRFFHQSCVWILDSNVERQLFVELSSSQNRPCGAWNISVHEYAAGGDDANHLGELLHTFCPRDKHKSYSLPWKLNTVVVRLSVMSRTLPQYRIKWRSQVVRANTRLASPTPAPNAASSAAGALTHASAAVALIAVSAAAALTAF